MASHNPTEKDLGFNPYVFDEGTYHKLNYTHYDPSNVDHRRRINKWKEKEKDRAKLAKALGVNYSPTLTPATEILKQLKKHS